MGHRKGLLAAANGRPGLCTVPGREDGADAPQQEQERKQDRQQFYRLLEIWQVCFRADRLLSPCDDDPCGHVLTIPRRTLFYNRGGKRKNKEPYGPVRERTALRFGRKERMKGVEKYLLIRQRKSVSRLIENDGQRDVLASAID